MAAGPRDGEWTLSQLGDLFGSLAALGSSDGRARLLERVAAFLPADAAVCRLVDERLAHGLGAEAAATLDGILASTEPVEVDLPGHAPLYVAVAPLPSQAGEWIAVLRTDDPFGGDDRFLLRAVASLLDLSLSSARAIAKLETRNTLLGVLREVERAISAQHSLAETLQRLTDGARRLFGRVVAGVALVHDGHLEVVAGSPVVDPPLLALPYRVERPGFMLRRMRGTLLAEIDDYVTSGEALPEVLALGIHRLLVAPIHPGPEPLGCLIIAATEDARTFTDDEREALRSLADHAAVVIEGARAREAVAASVVELERRAITDDLTELLNRRGLFAAIETVLARHVDDRRPMSVLFIDLDRFKFVNDLHGHHVADRVLIEAAARLNRVAGDGVVGRLAGDEFVVLLDGDVATCEEQAARIRRELEAPYEIDGISVLVGASVGVAALNGHGSASQLLMDADLAMMEAKQRGRGRTVRYGAGLRADREHRSVLERSIHDALSSDRFDVHLQPIVELASGRIDGAEVLLRWADATGAPLTPETVLTVASDAGLLPLLDMAVLRHALVALTAVQRRAHRCDLNVAVNITPATLSLPDLAERVLGEVARAGIAPAQVVLEFVETPAMDLESTIANLDALDHAGVLLALDNFGAGWSSLQRLRRVPLHRLKIDRSFVGTLDRSDSAEPIVKGLLQLAPAVGVDVVAEGIETAAQAHWLLANGCRFGQGYHLGHPCSADEFVGLLGVHADVHPAGTA